MIKYTIQSKSQEGIYYLVNGWNKHKTFWVKEKDLKSNMLFNTIGQAKASLTKLLKIMTDYKNDIFSIAEFNNDMKMTRQSQLDTQRNIVIAYINEHKNKFDELELTDFLQENNIEYMYFADTKELFDYFTEEDYNTLYFNKVIFLQDGSIIILEDF